MVNAPEVSRKGAEVLLAISREFGISIDWLLTGKVSSLREEPRG